MHVSPITTGKVKTRTLENHKGTVPMVYKLAEGAPPAGGLVLFEAVWRGKDVRLT